MSIFRPTPSLHRRAVATAPMRVSFAGGGSDLPPVPPGAGGRVVGAALELRVRAVAEPFDAGWVRLEVSAAPRTLIRRAGDPPERGIAFRLLEAALASAGIRDGVRLRVETDVAPGAGLGGSASAAVAALCALRAAAGEAPSADALAREATRIERDGLCLACGSQDQVFAAFGGLLDLGFDETGCVRRDALPDAPAALSELGRGLLLVDTLERRVSGEVLGRIPRALALDTAAELCAAAGEAVQAFREDSFERVLAAMRRSAAAKQRRDPAAGAPAVDLARRLDGLGVELVRTCGAGGGGHVLVWAPEARHGAIAALLGPGAVRKPALGAPGVRLERGASLSAPPLSTPGLSAPPLSAPPFSAPPLSAPPESSRGPLDAPPPSR